MPDGVRVSERGIVQGSGLRLSVCFARFAPGSSLARTSQLSLDGEWISYSETWPPSGSMQSGQCSARPTWKRRTCEDESSSWPTPRSSPNENRNTKPCPSRGNGHGKTLAGEAGLWGTPRSRMGGAASLEAMESGVEKCRLEAQAALWYTPTTRDWKDGACAEQAVPTNGNLGRQVCRDFRPDLPTVKDGNGSSNSTRRLNPLFVSLLMGFPMRWVDAEAEIELTTFDAWETQWSHNVRRLHFGFY